MNAVTPITISQTPDQEIIASSGMLTNDSVITLGNISNTIEAFTQVGVVRQMEGRFFYATSNDPQTLSISNLQDLTY